MLVAQRFMAFGGGGAIVNAAPVIQSHPANCRPGPGSLWKRSSHLGGQHMSVSGISSSSLFSTQDVQNNVQQAQQEFRQLGQDLQSGNLAAAQSDFSTLQSLQAGSTSSTSSSTFSSTSSSTQSNYPIAQAFTQLGEDLQSGNLSAAQQDYSTIQQDFQNQASQNQAGPTGSHHHHHHGGGSNAINQLFDQLGTELQAGDLATAQQTYSSLAQQLGQSSTSSSTDLPSPPTLNFSITA
jgi:outer membrane protein assembly factor BamD (BamD/ComL family)